VLLPVWGWQSLFVVAGIVPLVLAVLLAAFMPESLAFLGARGGEQSRMRKIAARIAPSLPADAELYSSERRLPGVPVSIFSPTGAASAPCFCGSYSSSITSS